MKLFWWFVLASWDFAISLYGTAHTELLCVCVASKQVQMLVACICHSACAVAWRQHLPPYLKSPPVCNRPYCHLSTNIKQSVSWQFWGGLWCNKKMAVVAGRIVETKALSFPSHLCHGWWHPGQSQRPFLSCTGWKWTLNVWFHTLSVVMVQQWCGISSGDGKNPAHRKYECLVQHSF